MNIEGMYGDSSGYGATCTPGSYANGAFYDDDQDMYVARTSPPSSPDVDKENVFCYRILIVIIERYGRRES